MKTVFSFLVLVSCFTTLLTAQSFTGTLEGSGSTGVQVIDFDGDTDLDIITSDYWTDYVYLYENDGSGTYTEHELFSSFWGPYDIDIKDIDQDGDTDIALVSYNNYNFITDVHWLENDGANNFTLRDVDLFVPGAIAVVIEDFNGDNEWDIAVTCSTASSNGEVHWWENDGTETWTHHYIAQSYYGANDIQALDVDGDTDVDLITTAFGNEEVTFWKNNGSGTFAYEPINTNCGGAFSAKPIDFDGDNDVDVVCSCQNDDKMIWLENDGAENFTEQLIDGNFSGPRFFEVVDLNMDTNLDVVAVGYYEWVLGYWLQDNAQNFTYVEISDVEAYIQNIAVGDLNNDGMIDLVTVAAGYSEMKVWTNGFTVLPVEMSHFNAKVENNERVLLDWATQNELDNSHFNVQRSVDGSTWETIGLVYGRGNSHSLSEYEAYDEDPYAGVSFYRLVQVDLDGTETPTEVKAVEIVRTEKEVSIYPVPAIDEVTVELGEEVKGEAVVMAYDMAGRMYFIPTIPSATKLYLDVNDLPEGMYTLSIQTDNLTSQQRLIVQGR